MMMISRARVEGVERSVTDRFEKKILDVSLAVVGRLKQSKLLLLLGNQLNGAFLAINVLIM